jgi:cysteine desulfurase / selenocysteine lyase
MNTPIASAVHKTDAATDLSHLRADFPVLHQQVHGKPLVYLDNAATSQKPRSVIDIERDYYERTNANVHRGVHLLSQRATDAYEGAREKVRAFLNAGSVREIVFVRGATEGINLVASSWGRRLRAGDEVVISAMEHHSNIVPWQLACEASGATLKVIPIHDSGELDMDAFRALLSERTRMVAVTHISNALGTVNPVHEIVRLAKAAGAAVLVDGAQAVAHCAVDVRALGCDFYVFSGHKLFAPTGTGVLYGRASLLEEMPPYQSGGDMIAQVTFERTTYNELPYKFEAGTPHIAGFIGLGAAIDYLGSVGLDPVAAWEADLLDYATEAAAAVPGLRVVGTAKDKASILSFVLERIHPHDIGTILDHEGVAIRTGHHCAMPVMDRLKVPATARASFAFYNSRDEVDALIRGLHKVIALFRR